MSIGDNEFDAVSSLSPAFNRSFWIIYSCILYVNTIIFLNFIIAEACASYQRVSDNIENYLEFQRC
jgi:hypothetical protein